MGKALEGNRFGVMAILLILLVGGLILMMFLWGCSDNTISSGGGATFVAQDGTVPPDPEFPPPDGGQVIPHACVNCGVVVLRDGGSKPDTASREDAGEPGVCPPAECYCDGQCDDEDFCTYDYCLHGRCVHDWSKVCNDNDPCTTDICDSSTKECSYVPAPEDTPCDDGRVCTAGDHCHSGLCEGDDHSDCE